MKVTKHYKLVCAIFSLLLLGGICTPTLSAYDSGVEQQSKPLKEVLLSFAERYEVLFSYDLKSVEGVQVHFEFRAGETLETAIQRLLAPTELGYKTFDQKYFVIYRQNKKGARSIRRMEKYFKKIHKLEETADLSLQVKPDEKLEHLRSVVTTSLSLPVDYTVTGTVTGDDGTPLVGATIRVKGRNQGTFTDDDGKFSMELPDGEQVLIVSYVGFTAKEVTVRGETNLTIALEADLTYLDEVVVVGYGTQKKSDLTGAVASIDGEELSNLPAPRVDQLLQGRLTGVNVTSANGAPGARTSIRFRGGNSIQGDNEPLYVIDGFVAGTNFDLNSINVNDIASVEVLKDASAVAIYGTRGANGVILVTTKDGKGSGSGKPSVSVNAYTGFQEILRKIDYLNGPDRAAWGNEYAEATGESNPFTDPTLIGNTDWQDIITETAAISNIDFSVNGHGDKVNYYFSANYLNQEGIVKNSGLERYNVRSNFDFQVADWMKFGARINLSHQNRDNSLISFSALETALTTFPRFNEEGSFWDENYVQGGPFDNPEAHINLDTRNSRNTNLLGNFYVEFTPLKGLAIRSTFGPNIVWNKNNTFISGRNPLSAASSVGGQGRIGNSYRVEFLQENTISYAKQINEDHKFDLLGGFTWQTSDVEFAEMSAAGIPNDAASYDILQLGNQESFLVNSGFGAFQLVSWIGRANYSFKDRYLLTIAGRVDGSSRFASSDNEYGFFPSAAFAWRVIEEPFIKDLGIFSNLKLRASYGRSGSQSINSFATLATYETINTVYNNNIVGGVRRNRPSNPELQWETTDQVDVGIEMGFFNNRLSLELDYYYKKTNDLLLSRQIPGQTGFNERLENVGSLQNQGLELLLTSVNIANDDFFWSTTLTLSGNRSKVLDLGGVDEIVILGGTQFGDQAKLIVGEPVGVFTGLEYLGTWQSQEILDREGYTGVPALLGGPRFLDTDGNGEINQVVDGRVIGNPEPDFYGGLGNTFSYKGFTLDVFFQGTFGNDVYNRAAGIGFFGRSVNNLYTSANDRWTPQNTTSRVPRAGTVIGITDVPSNSELIEDGTHIRLKNVRLAYSIDNGRLLGMRNFSVYVSGTNLLLFSDFRGFDPEALDFTPGNSNTYTNVLRGFASMQYPSARTITFGFNANF